MENRGMETIKRVGLVILFVVWHALCGSATARPNIQRLNPTGYSLQVAYDDAPFFVGGEKIYALPKGLKVQILAMSGINMVYGQLPDGSRGLFLDRYFGGSTLQLNSHLYHKSGNLTVQEGVYDILSIGSWRKGKQGNYLYTSDRYQLRHQRSKRVITIPIGATGAKANNPTYAYQGQVPEESIRRDVIVVVKNPAAIGHLIGRTMADVEGYLGQSKAFVGDALTDVGYAYSFYRNVAYDKGGERVYGLYIFYDKHAICVDAAWVPFDGASMVRRYEPQEFKVSLPRKRVEGAVRVDCAARLTKPLKPMPRYDLAVAPTHYEHEQSLTLKNLSFARVADALAGENLLSTLFTIFFFYGLFVVIYLMVLKHTAVGSNTLHTTILFVVGLACYATGVYGMWKFPLFTLLLGAFLLFLVVGSLYRWISGRIGGQRCPYCYYFYGKMVHSHRTGGYERTYRDTHTIRKDYQEIGELERLNDEQIRRWEWLYRHELRTEQYGKYEGQVVCPKCLAKWFVEFDMFENEVRDITGYSRRMREEVWKMRQKD